MIESSLKKEQHLLAWLESQEAVAVAFSGGVDSAYLAWAAAAAMKNRLGKGLAGKVLAITACTQSFTRREVDETRKLAEQIGIACTSFEFDQFSVAEFAANPPDRCYHCKTEILKRIKAIAFDAGISCMLEGSNKDDDKDYRPGARAVREQGFLSPLKEAGLTKEEIRFLSKKAGLPTWDKQSAACLASRYAYGEIITAEGLRMVEQAEEFLRDLGIRGQMRVRIHGGNLARIEVTEEQIGFLMADEVRRSVDKKMKEFGFSYVTLDLKGYRMGSMNEVLSKN